MLVITYCDEIWYDPDGDADPCDCIGNNEYFSHWECYTTYIDTGGGGDGNGNGDGGGGTGGGGTGGDTDPCGQNAWFKQNPCPQNPPDDDVPSDDDLGLPPFIWTFTGDDGTTFTDADPLKQPEFRFDEADNYETLYPRFTNMVKNLKTFVKENPKVMTALQKWSGFSKQQIIDKLTFGKGLTIKIENIENGSFGTYDGKKQPLVLKVRKSYVLGLEQSHLESTQQATAFLLAVTILHEFVHYGTTHNGISEGVYDFGFGFEWDAFNVFVNEKTAGKVYIEFKKYF